MPNLTAWIVPISLVILTGLVRDPEARHRAGRQSVRTDHGRLVRHAGGARPVAYRPASGHSRGGFATFAIAFVTHSPGTAFIVLGSVFLALTGGEALYADMGHFGKKPIRLAWMFLVWPSLVLNYFGQAALVLMQPVDPQAAVLRVGARLGARAAGASWPRPRPSSRRRR